MIIASPLPIAALVVGGTAGAGSGYANLLTSDPKEIFVAGAGNAQTVIDIDLGSAADVDFFFLGFTNMSLAATWSIDKATGLGSGLANLVPTGATRPFDALGSRWHAFAQLAAPANSRYFRIKVDQTGAALQAGILMLGKKFQAPYELGGGRTVIDTGAKEPLPSGGFGLGDGVVKAGLRWTFPDLSPADRRKLWSIVYGRGERQPVVVVEETGEDAGLHEEIHYGLFDRFQAYEREAPGATRWALSMTEWV
jgi:hypothetical protein